MSLNGNVLAIYICDSLLMSFPVYNIWLWQRFAWNISNLSTALDVTHQSNPPMISFNVHNMPWSYLNYAVYRFKHNCAMLFVLPLTFLFGCLIVTGLLAPAPSEEGPSWAGTASAHCCSSTAVGADGAEGASRAGEASIVDSAVAGAHFDEESCTARWAAQLAVGLDGVKV